MSSTRRTNALSARVRNNLDVVAGANAAARDAGKPDVIEVIPTSPAEQAYYSAALARARQPEASPAPVSSPRTNGAKAPRRTNGTGGRPRARSGAKSGDGEDGLDPPPPKRPRGHGVARLLHKLAFGSDDHRYPLPGLDPEALAAAAALVIELDEIAFPSLEEARREHLEAKARRWS